MLTQSTTTLRSMICLLFLACNLPRVQAQEPSFNLLEATVPEMQSAMDHGLITSASLVQQYLNRIAAFDDGGAMLNSVLALNPNALATAQALDEERAASGPRGPLHGIPVLLKDNIDTFDMPTTAGALVLKNSIPPDDAFITQRLRDAGAVILGKAALSEWANWMSFDKPNDFNAVNGHTLNPYGPQSLDSSGSSNGSAVSVAANFAALTVGTETSGSIVGPAWANSAVGIRPTMGLVSRNGIIPLSHSWDTAGPITRTVTDAAIMLGTLAGVDPNDPVTSQAGDQVPTNYTQFLNANGLEGKRIGVVRGTVVRPDYMFYPTALPVYQQAIDELANLGATIVDNLDLGTNVDDLFTQFPLPAAPLYEFAGDLEVYLASLGENAPVRTLADVIAYNNEHADEAIPYGQGLLELAVENGPKFDSPEYHAAIAESLRLMGEDGLLRLLAENDLDALVFTEAWSFLGATPGLPTVSVPAGYDELGVPVSIEFLGNAFTEPALIEMAYAYEQATQRRQPPATAPSIAGDFIGFGDFDNDQRLTAVDIGLLSLAIREGQHDLRFDVNGDGAVGAADLDLFVVSRGYLNTEYGDSDLNGWFDSSDLILVFQAGEYEDGVNGNSSWSTGDWDGDGEFDSRDIMLAFEHGGYSPASHAGLPDSAAVAVPELGSLTSLMVGIALTTAAARRRRVAS